MEKKYKIFELGEPKENGQYTEIEIIGLNELYAGVGKHAHRCDGAVGLLYASDEYPGCCQMYYTWRSQPEEDGELRIEFYPAYTKDGDYILIKTPNETPLMFFTSKVISYDRKTMKENKIGFLSYKTDGWNSYLPL